jgi:hypothetical protein
MLVLNSPPIHKNTNLEKNEPAPKDQLSGILCFGDFAAE